MTDDESLQRKRDLVGRALGDLRQGLEALERYLDIPIVLEPRRSYPCLDCGAPTEPFGPFDSTGPYCGACWLKRDVVVNAGSIGITATNVREEIKALDGEAPR